jgi:hypothetical protein
MTKCVYLCVCVCVCVRQRVLCQTQCVLQCCCVIMMKGGGEMGKLRPRLAAMPGGGGAVTEAPPWPQSAAHRVLNADDDMHSMLVSAGL